MRCLYCGKEYFLPSQIRRDPDFCGAAHREKYNRLVERAMRCIQESSPLPASEPMPAPVMAAPPAPVPPAAARATAGLDTVDRPVVAAYATVRAELTEAPGAAGMTAAAAEGTFSGKLKHALPDPACGECESPDQAPSLVNSALSHLARPRRFRESPHLPRLATRPVFERLQAERLASAPEEKTLEENKVEEKETATPPTFGLLETAWLARRKGGRFALIAVAASLAVGGVLWIGANAIRFGKGFLHSAPAETTAAPGILPAPAPGNPGESAVPHQSLAWLRSAAFQHAAAHLSEGFERGMAAWGEPPAAWAPGWSHSPDGYVRPGQLALFQPTLGYADYRMEFFGEIENKSLSWVVRGKDSRNYYAMKLTLVQPGLRPLLSLAHYPVLDGKPGRAVEVPLSTMIHNGVPYHVAVQVQGSNYTVAIEGEPVDSWSDDALPAGGVGFFAEPGARARVYWLKVAKNDNWLGWLCSRIAGDPASPTGFEIPRRAI